MKRAASLAVALVALSTVAVARVFAHAAPGPQTAAESAARGVDKAKDAVVAGSKVAADKTREGLSKTGEVITDEWITTRIHARFVGEDLLKDSDISVNTSKHVVTLKGTVVARAGRTKAGSLALDTEGVRKVINRVTVGPKPRS